MYIYIYIYIHVFIRIRFPSVSLRRSAEDMAEGSTTTSNVLHYCCLFCTKGIRAKQATIIYVCMFLVSCLPVGAFSLLVLL